MNEQGRSPWSVLSTGIMMLAMVLFPAFAHPIVIGCTFCLVGIIGLIAWSTTPKSGASKDTTRKKVLGYTTCILLAFGMGCIYFGVTDRG